MLVRCSNCDKVIEEVTTPGVKLKEGETFHGDHIKALPEHTGCSCVGEADNADN